MYISLLRLIFIPILDDDEPDWIVVKTECSRPQVTDNTQLLLFCSVFRVGKIWQNILSENKVRFTKAPQSLLQCRVFCSVPILSDNHHRAKPWIPQLYFNHGCTVGPRIAFSSIICFIWLHSAIFGLMSCNSSLISLLQHYIVKLVVCLCWC